MSTLASSPARIAFIGLGNMGGPMAANLVAAGHQVYGYDPSPAASAAARAAGVQAVRTAADAVLGGIDGGPDAAEVVITMLPTGRHVLDVYHGPRGLLEVTRPGTLFVDCSTIDVADARRAAGDAQSAGHRAIDAPVSGGTLGAANGTLTFMVGAT